jgi:Domain of unknown function (DUF4342)
MNNESTERSAPKNAASKDQSARARTWTEEIEVAGDELVVFVKRLAAEGQVRRVRLIEPDGDIVLDMPLTIGAIAGGAVVLAAPMLAILGAFAAFVAKVKLEIIRTGDAPTDKSKSG